MSWGMVAVGAGTAIAGWLGSNAAEDGADAQVQAANYAADLQNRQWEQTRQDMMPWLDAGRWALGRQQDFLRGDYTNALNSPDYLAANEMGLRALDRQHAGSLSLLGGGADADRIRFAGDLATQKIDNYWNRLAGVSGTGQTTAGQIGQFGANAANQMGQSAMNAANARASAYAGQANAWGNAIQGMTGLAGMYFGNRAANNSTAAIGGNALNNAGGYYGLGALGY